MRSLAAAVFTLLSGTAFAAQFTVTSAGKAVDNAEVCLFAAGSSSAIYSRYFASSEVKCHSAAAEVAIPAGEWNVYARSGRDLVSDRVEVVTSSTKQMQLTVGPAAALTFDRPAKDSALFVYVPRTQSAIPVIDGLVPGDAEILPVVTAGGRIVALGRLTTIPAGATAASELSKSREGRADVLVPVIFRSTPEERVEPPSVVLTDAEKTPQKNALPIRRAVRDSIALALFRDVAAGELTIEANGPRWSSAVVKTVAKPGLTIVDSPLVVRTTSKLTVHWWTPLDPASLRPASGTCDALPSPFLVERISEAKTFKATLLICPEDKKRMDQCSESTSRELPTGVLKGEVTFEDVPAGSHFVRFEYPDLPVTAAHVDVAPKRSSEADAELRWVSFFGRVTRGGKPVHARVFGAVSDPDTGRYVAVFTRMPGDMLQFVMPCDRSFSPFRFIPDPAPVENAAYDVEVPENQIAITVVDKKSGVGIRDAKIYVAAALPEDKTKTSAAFAGPADGPNTTDDKGELTIGPMLKNREINVCARHEDYEGGCSEWFTMKEDKKVIRLELERSLKLRGRVAAAAGAKRAMLVWFAPNGEIAEMIRAFKPDGSFTYKKRHAEGEVFAFISEATPLFVFLQPRLGDDDLFDIVLPQARVRSFSVTVGPSVRGSGSIGLKIGEIFVPINALMWHLMARPGMLHSAMLSAGQTQQVSDILETGPISVVFVPVPPVPVQGAYSDPLFGPERNAFPRKPLGEASSIVIE